MPNTLRKSLPSMTVAEFLDWPGDGTGRKCRLIDGEVRVMWPGSTTHGRLQTEKTGEGGILTFDSIGFSCQLSEIYARTHLGSEHLS